MPKFSNFHNLPGPYEKEISIKEEEIEYYQEPLDAGDISENEDLILNALSGCGIPRSELNLPSLEKEEETEEEKVKRILDANGASVINAAKTISDVMAESRFDSSRLRAAEIALDLHGVRDKEGAIKKQPIFQFFINDSRVQIANIFSPHRSRLTPSAEE